jgi:hypothetical protein
VVCDAHFTEDDTGGYAGFMLLKGLNDLTSVNRDFFFVFEIKGNSLFFKSLHFRSTYIAANVFGLCVLVGFGAQSFNL